MNTCMIVVIKQNKQLHVVNNTWLLQLSIVIIASYNS